MASILIIGPDPETMEILKLRFEVDGHSVHTALKKDDAVPLMQRVKPDVTVIDVIECGKDARSDISAITKKAIAMKALSVLLLPRSTAPAEGFSLRTCDVLKAKEEPQKADLLIKKPYELSVLVKEIYGLINTPRRSCSSHKDSRRPS